MFSKNNQAQSFMKVREVGAELFHEDVRADRRTDRYDEANRRFLQFSELA
jgi:hypothetical protein